MVLEGATSSPGFSLVMSLVASSAVATRGISVIPNVKMKAKVILIFKLYTPLAFYFQQDLCMESLKAMKMALRPDVIIRYMSWNVSIVVLGAHIYHYDFVSNIYENGVLRKKNDW